jgi:hypothetical protein
MDGTRHFPRLKLFSMDNEAREGWVSQAYYQYVEETQPEAQRSLPRKELQPYEQGYSLEKIETIFSKE